MRAALSGGACRCSPACREARCAHVFSSPRWTLLVAVSGSAVDECDIAGHLEIGELAPAQCATISAAAPVGSSMASRGTMQASTSSPRSSSATAATRHSRDRPVLSQARFRLRSRRCSRRCGGSRSSSGRRSTDFRPRLVAPRRRCGTSRLPRRSSVASASSEIFARRSRRVDRARHARTSNSPGVPSADIDTASDRRCGIA